MLDTQQVSAQLYYNDVCTPLADIPLGSSLRAADRVDLL